MTRLRHLWRGVRPLLAPLLLCALVVLTLREPLVWWLHGEEKYDREALTEWLIEARNVKTLHELVGEYLELADRQRELARQANPATAAAREQLSGRRIEVQQNLDSKLEELSVFLKALGNATKMSPGQLPLFPVVYRLQLDFADDLQLPSVVWDSELPRQPGQYREMEQIRVHARAFASLQYQ